MQNIFSSNGYARGQAGACERHARAIDLLVLELGLPSNEVMRTYYAVLEDMKKNPSIPAFLPILASITVKERLMPLKRPDGIERPALAADVLR